MILLALIYWPISTAGRSADADARGARCHDEGGLTGMGTPSWLYYLFGVLMLAVAGYCVLLFR